MIRRATIAILMPELTVLLLRCMLLVKVWGSCMALQNWQLQVSADLPENLPMNIYTDP